MTASTALDIGRTILKNMRNSFAPSIRLASSISEETFDSKKAFVMKTFHTLNAEGIIMENIVFVMFNADTTR